MWRARELEDLIGCWTLDEADLGLIANKSGATRLGFALALKFFEQEARFPRHAGELPPAAGEVRSGPGQGRSGYVRRVRVVGSDGRLSPGAAQGRAGLPREPVVGDEDKLADWAAYPIAADGEAWPLAVPSLSADWVSCPATRRSRYRPASIAGGSQRQQDPPHQEPQVPDPDVPAQRRPVRASRRVDDTREDEGAREHVQAAVHHEERTGRG